MTEQDWQAATYGPPATGAPHAVGETLIYDDCGSVENGEILYVAATNPQTGEVDIHYIVSPADDIFPTPIRTKFSTCIRRIYEMEQSPQEKLLTASNVEITSPRGVEP